MGNTEPLNMSRQYHQYPKNPQIDRKGRKWNIMFRNEEKQTNKSTEIDLKKDRN